jgi:DNA-binding NarL/FixJ family response regulator
MAKILLVEDEDHARRMLVLGLQRLGHAVVGCANGLEALGNLEAGVEVIVTDLIMPKLDGIKFLQEVIAREHPAMRIVITSFADKERALTVLNLGVHYLIEKPFSVDQLDQVIHKVLSKMPPGGNISQIFQHQLLSLPLSERERQLVVSIMKGLPNNTIATHLGISEQAVKSALFALYKKLGISSRGELFHLIFPI